MGVEVERDRWGRPLILQLDDSVRPYTRVSTLAKMVDDGTNLAKWRTRMTVKGLVENPMLWAHTMTGEDMLEAAFIAGGGQDAADLGTELHTLSEALDIDPLAVHDAPGGRSAWARAYLDTTWNLKMLEAETFIVNDTLEAAGTFDRLVQLPDGRVVVADLKTGKWDAKYPAGVATQIAVYASGNRYDPETGNRGMLHPDLDVSTGLLIHVPADGSKAGLYLLDLDKGYTRACLATTVRRMRQVKESSYIVDTL